MECVPKDALSKQPHPCFILRFHSVDLVMDIELERFFTLAAGVGSRAMFFLSLRLRLTSYCTSQWIIRQWVSLIEPIATLRLEIMLHGVAHALPHGWHT